MQNLDLKIGHECKSEGTTGSGRVNGEGNGEMNIIEEHYMYT
jgi:hypothetical protein